MTQATTQIGAGQSGLAYRSADNDGKRALLNHHKGSAAPSYAEAGIIWLDDNATPWKLKTYDGADWITLGEVNATNNTFQPYNGTATPRVLHHAGDTGSANTYAIAPAPAITAYATGQIVTLRPGNANTGAATINVNSLGAKSIKLLSGANPAAGALLTTGVYILMYDGTNFVVLNPSLLAFTGDSGSGGAAGLVPAPAAGDAAAGKVLGAGGGWVATSSSVTVNAQSANYTLLAADRGLIVTLTGSTARTFSFTAAATLGSGWACYLYNAGTAELTLDPNGSETIDGLTSYIMYPGEVRLVQCSGTAFTTLILNGGAAVFNSSGSWKRPPGYSAFEVDIISGGAAGSARATTGNAAGGAGGASYRFTVPASALVAVGSTETVTVGGAAAGVSGSNNGTKGNNSAFTVNGSAITVAGPDPTAGDNTNGATTTAVKQSYGGAISGLLSGTQNIFYWQHTGDTVAAVGTLLYGGGAGGDVTSGAIPAAGGNSIHGGGGGGGCSSTAGGTRTGGTSVTAGAGGAGGANTGGNGTDGTAPGGGGGGAVQGGTSGAGAPGRVTIRGVL